MNTNGKVCLTRSSTRIKICGFGIIVITKSMRRYFFVVIDGSLFQYSPNDSIVVCMHRQAIDQTQNSLTYLCIDAHHSFVLLLINMPMKSIRRCLGMQNLQLIDAMQLQLMILMLVEEVATAIYCARCRVIWPWSHTLMCSTCIT